MVVYVTQNSVVFYTSYREDYLLCCSLFRSFVNVNELENIDSAKLV